MKYRPDGSVDWSDEMAAGADGKSAVVETDGSYRNEKDLAKLAGTVNSADGDSGELPLARRTVKGTPEQRQALSVDTLAILESNRKASEMFQQAMFGGSANLKTASEAIGKYGDAAAEVATIQGAIEVAQLMQKDTINKVLQASVNSPDSIIVDSHKKRSESRIKMDMLKPVIDAESAVQIWDDPLRYIANQFTLPALKSEFNQAAKTEAIMSARIARTQQEAAAQQNIDPAIVAEEIGRAAAGRAAAIKFKAIQEASQTLAQSNEFAAKAVLQEIAINNQDLDRTFQLARLQQESSSYARARAVDEKQNASDKRKQKYVDLMSTWLNAIGMPSIDVPSLELMGKEKASRLMNLAETGVYGNGPGDALAAINEFGSLQKFQQSNPVVAKFITDLYTSKDYTELEAKKLQDPRFAALGIDQQRQLVLQDLFANQRSAADKSDTDNSKLKGSHPYNLKHAAATINPSLVNNIFAKEVPVLMNLSADKKTVRDHDLLLLFQGKVEAEPGKVKELAAEMADYYSKSAEFQWTKSGAMMTGYPKFQRYGVTDPSTGKPINAMSALELESWAMRRLAARLRARETMSLFGVNNDIETPSLDVLPVGMR